jgi:polysaccharide pyruvyl transferase WcaK-like protein
VSGAYHAAVFALAQGIPVVCIASSQNEYYNLKFRGLEELFPCGCIIVHIDRRDAADALQAAMVRLWDSAPAVRERLCEAAERQIAASHAAYDRFAGMLRARLSGRGSNGSGRV